jgi:hypothetical protein
MRSTVRWYVLAALSLIPVSVLAQNQAPPPAPAASTAAAPATAAPTPGAPAAPAASGDAAAPAEPKKPTTTPGYSWTDKPQKWRRAKRKKIDPNAPLATYPGFRMLKDGRSEVWVQISKKVSVTPSVAAGHATFVLSGVDVGIRNNTNPLVTEYFDTPLARARLKRDGNGAQLVLELREAVSPKHRIVDGPAGTMTLYVELPKAQRSYSVTEDGFDRSHGRRTKTTLPAKGSRRGPTP